MISIVLSALSNTLGQYGALKARKLVHHRMLNNIILCPLSFFDSTPIGRIDNCFSNDLVIIDKVCITIHNCIRLYTIYTCHNLNVIPKSLIDWYLENWYIYATLGTFCFLVFMWNHRECYYNTLVFNNRCTHMSCLLYSSKILPMFLQVPI